MSLIAGIALAVLFVGHKLISFLIKRSKRPKWCTAARCEDCGTFYWSYCNGLCDHCGGSLGGFETVYWDGERFWARKDWLELNPEFISNIQNKQK